MQSARPMLAAPLAILVVLSAAGVVHAGSGQKENLFVNVVPTGDSAIVRGSLYAIRHSSNPRDRLECVTSWNESDAAVFGGCTAETTMEVEYDFGDIQSTTLVDIVVECSSKEPEFVEQVRSIPSHAKLILRIADLNCGQQDRRTGACVWQRGRCASLAVIHASSELP